MDLPLILYCLFISLSSKSLMLILTRLEGGPKRVNHAAVAVDGIIYSFGGYMGFEDYSIERPIDVFTLNTVTLRWKELQYSDTGINQFALTKVYIFFSYHFNSILFLSFSRTFFQCSFQKIWTHRCSSR